MATVRVFNHHVHSSFYWLALVDGILFVLAFYVGAHIYFNFLMGSIDEHLPSLPTRALAFALTALVCLGSMGLYEPRTRERAGGILLRMLGGFIAVAAASTSVYYLFPEVQLWRVILLYSVLIACAGTMVSRLTFTRITGLNTFKSRVLIYGSGDAASTVTTAMRRQSDRQGFTIVGFVRAPGEETKVDTERLISLRQPLDEYTRQTEIDEIVVALDDKRAALPMGELFNCRLNGVRVIDLVNFFEREAGKIVVDFANPSWLVFSDGFKKNIASRVAKRGFDLGASLLLCAVAWPFMLLTAMAIWLEDGFGAPILFYQERVGLRGKIFRVVKFRSMSVDAEGDGKARWATKNDSRATRVGNFIRKTRIDELPQIMNVLNGSMSFIGPRPERPEFVRNLAQKIPYFNARHCVKPGITGWAQLRYPYGASEEDSRQKLQFDLYYVKNQSLFLDLMIAMNTVEVVLFGKGAR